MGINAKFGSGKVDANVAAFQQRLIVAMVYMLRYLGESLVKYAREQHNYTDQTGNLTNSIGYVVIHKGDVKHTGGFEQSGTGGNEGYNLAMKMVSRAKSDYSLIIVAGMNYAAYVESKGYNVILPAELKAKSEFPAMMQRFVKQAKSKANELFSVN